MDRDALRAVAASSTIDPVLVEVCAWRATSPERIPPLSARRAAGGAAAAHLVAALAATAFLTMPSKSDRAIDVAPHREPQVVRLVYLVTSGPGGGGGGGGRRQRPSPARAQAPGADHATLPIARPIVAAPVPSEPDPVPAQAVVLDARPLASGFDVRVGLPDVVTSGPASFGPGTGGGMGDGAGTGIGSGHGPGLGPGTGGGTGGGVYRPGGDVSPPTLLHEERPTYSSDALQHRVEGVVELEAIVRENGTADAIRVVRSLDRELDGNAVEAVRRWRFAPGRRRGEPVPVLVTIAVRFSIR